MAVQLPPIPNNPITDTFVWRDWFFKISQALVQQASIAWTSLDFTGSNLLDIQTRQHGALQAVQGGLPGQQYHLTNAEHTQVVNNLHNSTNGLQGGTIGEYYHLTAIQNSVITTPPFIEAVETGAGPFTLSATPALLIPTTVNNAQGGLSYDTTNGEFTFTYPGIYNLTLAINVFASSANQKVYIYAENNTGSGWVVNTNSGKQVELVNGAVTQIQLSVGTRRVAGQKVRYWIYSNSTNVSLSTTTLGATGAVVPAIRIVYTMGM